MGLENILTSSWIEIDQAALENNLQYIKNLIGERVQLAAVVKSNAYGCGFDLITQACQQASAVTYLAVFSVTEALRARQLGFTKNILVLCYHGWCESDLKQAIAQEVELTVYTLAQLQNLQHLARASGQPALVQIKIDTGLARLGFSPAQARAILQDPNFTTNFTHLKLRGIFTHLAESEKQDSAFTVQQLQDLTQLVFDLRQHNIQFELVHAAGSSATFLVSICRFDLVRIGGMMYGLSKLPNPNLKFILSWKTRIIQIKELLANTPVGYNRTFVTQRATKIAILPVGYCDGYSRQLSNVGQVLINGVLAPVIGRVAMNMLTVDVTNVPAIAVGDIVTLLGAYAGVTPADWSAVSNIYIYESIVNLNPNITRFLI